MSRAHYFVILVLLLLSGVATAADPAAGGSELLINAYRNFTASSGYHMTTDSLMTVPVGKELPGQSTFLVRTQTSSDVQASPWRLRSITTVRLEYGSGVKQKVLQQYGEEREGVFSVYSKLDNGWERQAVSLANFRYDPLTEYERYFRAIRSVRVLQESEASVNYQVVVDSAYLRDIVDHVLAAAADRVGRLPESVYADIDEFTYTVEIDKRTMLIAKMEMDASPLLASIGARLAAAQEIPENQRLMLRDLLASMQLRITVIFSQRDASDPIVIPAEALQAAAIQAE
ncbi:MAG: hypothetical protein E6X17_13695 [Sporomusaceae bacterium]|nr:hypothetical protein [Sporomusaceae bacterium]